MGACSDRGLATEGDESGEAERRTLPSAASEGSEMGVLVLSLNTLRCCPPKGEQQGVENKRFSPGPPPGEGVVLLQPPAKN